MFNLFSLKKDNRIYAPVEGYCIDITQVDDIAFSSKSMGDGVAIIPTSNVIVSPCDGELKMIFRTGHAFGIQSTNGLELLVHIGIDTVNLNGKGFKVLKKVNEKIKRGEPIVEIDLDTLKKDYDMSTLIIVTNGKLLKKMAIEKEVLLNDVIFAEVV